VDEYAGEIVVDDWMLDVGTVDLKVRAAVVDWVVDVGVADVDVVAIYVDVAVVVDWVICVVAID